MKQLILGVSSTLLTYGGVGSGKTYSLFGGEKEHEKGLIQRALELLIEKKGPSELTVSFYEAGVLGHCNYEVHFYVTTLVSFELNYEP